MHIFVSYSKSDTRELALRLTAYIEAEIGLSAWMDKSLQVGEDWARRIQKEIDDADLMLALLSPDVNRETEPPSFVLREVHYAQAEKKPVIPILAEQAKIPVQLAGIQYRDLTQNQEIEIGLLVEDLRKRAGILISRQARRKLEKGGVEPEVEARRKKILEELRADARARETRQEPYDEVIYQDTQPLTSADELEKLAPRVMTHSELMKVFGYSVPHLRANRMHKLSMGQRLKIVFMALAAFLVRILVLFSFTLTYLLGLLVWDVSSDAAIIDTIGRASFYTILLMIGWHAFELLIRLSFLAFLIAPGRRPVKVLRGNFDELSRSKMGKLRIGIFRGFRQYTFINVDPDNPVKYRIYYVRNLFRNILLSIEPRKH